MPIAGPAADAQTFSVVHYFTGQGEGHTPQLFGNHCKTICEEEP
jgi:hypothetical protein